MSEGKFRINYLRCQENCHRRFIVISSVAKKFFPPKCPECGNIFDLPLFLVGSTDYQGSLLISLYMIFIGRHARTRRPEEYVFVLVDDVDNPQVIRLQIFPRESKTRRVTEAERRSLQRVLRTLSSTGLNVDGGIWLGDRNYRLEG